MFSRSYVFQEMMINEFALRNYSCATTAKGDCSCMYPSALEGECKIAGQAVLDQYGYSPGQGGLHAGILLCIVLGYRLLTWLVLWMRKT